MQIFIFFSFFISAIFFVLVSLTSFLFNKNLEKSSLFECGFYGLDDSRLSFSIYFFLFSLIFLLFDVEVTFLLPLSYFMSSHIVSYLSVLVFLLLIFFGTYYEWMKGIFDWLG